MFRQAMIWLIAMASVSQSLAAFEYYPGVGYYSISENNYMNWTNGFSWCQSSGSDLVVINSFAEEKVVKQMLTSRRILQAFVGVSDIITLGDLVTVTGEPLSRAGFQIWLGGSPSTDPNNRCVAYNTNASGGLVKIDCLRQYFICERPLWRNDYALVAGYGYYKVNTTAVLWRDAWKTCREEGANLAVINSAEELAILQDIIRKHPDLPTETLLFHIGLHAQYGMGYFVTVEGVPVKRSGFNQWEEGHPTFNAVYARLVRNGVLDSTQFNQRLPFICEHSLV